MRSTLATVILRLLGSRVVYGDVDLSNPGYAMPSKRDRDTEKKKSANALDLSGRNIFDWLLLVLHALLSRFQPSWLKVKSVPRATNESSKVSSGIDRETLENLQVWFSSMHFLKYLLVFPKSKTYCNLYKKIFSFP